MSLNNKNKSKYKTFIDYYNDNNNRNTTSTDLSGNISNIKNLNTTHTYFNMTIKKIIEDMKIQRNNNKKLFNKIKINKHLQKITKSLDANNTLDASNNQIVTYNKKESLTDFLLKIHTSSENYGKNSSFFNYSQPLLNSKNHYPSLLIPALPPPIIKKCHQKKIKKINIQINIKNINDLIKLANDYPLKNDIQYNINMKAIHNIKEPLIELKNMIGMKKLKNSIIDQILYFIQEFHKNQKKINQDFMHTVIYGPPGTGKTETAKIIGKIFSKLGILSKNYFKKVTRADLIAGYLGQTAIKTQKIIKECLGGVLFIDEAYSLGNSEKRDSFAKECIDTLCEALSDNKENLMVIIAGYKKELDECFFAYNKGLDSRFSWRFNTIDYTYEELFLIFKKKVNDINWKIKTNEIKNSWFKERMNNLLFFGRDIETLLAKVKIAHGRRVFCLPIEEKKIITLCDLNKGYNIFLENNCNNKDKKIEKEILSQMYC